MENHENSRKKVPVTRIGCMVPPMAYLMAKLALILLITMLLNAYVLGYNDILLIADVALLLVVTVLWIYCVIERIKVPSINKQLKCCTVYGLRKNLLITQSGRKCKKLKKAIKNNETEDTCVLKCMDDDFQVIKEYGRKNPQYTFRAYTQTRITYLIIRNSNHYNKRKFGKCKTLLGKILFEELWLEKRMIKNICDKCPRFGTENCGYKISSESNTYKKKREQMYGIIFDFREDA